MKMKKLVAYFSAGGSTKAVAQKLAAAAGADIFEIKPAVPYTAADLNWMDKNSRATVEANDKSSRPAMAEKLASAADYEAIFLGFPIWWYTAPAIIKTFLESCDLSGKKIILFATSGGSGFGKTADDLKACCPASARVVAGKLLNGASEKDIAAFAKNAEAL